MNPLQMMIPPWFWQQQQQDQPQPTSDSILPVRVHKAFEFINILSNKTMNRAAVGESGAPLPIDGQELSDEEATTLATACNMLTSYFGGTLRPDIWENLRIQAIHKQLADGAVGADVPGHILHCVACTPGPANQNCKLCRGSGRILVFGAGPAQDAISETDSEQAD